MNRIIGIVLLTALNVITSFATLGLLVLFFGLGNIAFEEIFDIGLGSVIFLLFYILVEIIKWIVYIFILLRRREKLRYFFVGYGLFIAFIALYLGLAIPIIIGLLYLAVVYFLKEEKVTVENDYLLFDEEPMDDVARTNRDTPFIIGLTLLVIVAFYLSWTTLESTFIVIRHSLNLGMVPLLHLVLDIGLALFCWVSLYKVIRNRQSNWKYYFAGLFIVNTTILIFRTIELSKLEYFTSVFMMLDPVRIFMMGFNIIGFLLLIRKDQEEEEVDL